MYYICGMLYLSFSLSFVNSENSSGFSKVTYENFFKAGVDAYLENRWKDCVTLFEKSIEDYIYYTAVIVQCRKKCEYPNLDNVWKENINISDIWEFQTFITAKALCLMKCQKSYFLNRPKISKEVDADFESKVPYNYLQLCYFKMNEVEKAASCAYTFLIHNPGHEVMKSNLQYYLSLSNIDVDKIKYLEPKTYQDLFLKGALLYSEGKFSDSIEVMEASLQEYQAAEENCRLLCEGSLPELMQEELFISITNHWTYSLRCKLNCPKKLSYMFGQKHDQLFTNHYHYLQFNYYKVNKFKETCAAVQSFLLFHPNDETMLANKHFYATQPSISEDWFTPRKEAVDYYNKYKRESSLLEAIENFFKLENTSEISKSPIPPPGSSAKAASFSHENLGEKKDKLSEKEISAWFKASDILPIMKEGELNGTNRVVFSNVVSENECQQLMDLAEGGGLYGDGYNGKESPHTQFEMFEGLTVARAAMLSQRGILNPLAAELFLNVSEKARKAVEVFFNLETELFFAYTHLVCRTALPDSTSSRQDLSHPIHADNCILKPSGECLKEKPAYTWRDYSSIVYLNEDFDGGEFIFARNKNKIQASIKPKCGHMVAFSAGKENLHGVKAVTNGRRCALAMWYTLNSFYRERERDFAETVLRGLWNKRQLANRVTKSDYVKSALHKFVENTKQEHLHIHSEL